MRVVLFDIDGTLLKSGGAWRRSMERALTEVFGSPGSSEYHYGGKTDRQIVRDLMRREGFTDEAIDAQMDQLRESYVAGLATELESGNRTMLVLDGVVELLDALDRDASGQQRAVRSPRGQELDTAGAEGPGELHDSGLVGDGQKGAANWHVRGVSKGLPAVNG